MNYIGNKIKVGVLFGGRSTEHEISILSAKNIIDNLDSKKYELVLIGIDKKGHFYFSRETIKKNIPHASILFENKSLRFCHKIPSQMNECLSKYIDVAFPIFHGYLGEDGAIQGLLKVFDIPFVGPDVLASSVCMDKEVTKRLLREAGVPISDFLVLHRPEKISYEDASKQLGTVIFVKPALSGSSVGINKATNSDEFEKAISEAYEYDNKLIIEQAVLGREIECAVIGNENPIASAVCGEIIAKRGFYSYEAKYIDSTLATLKIPAELSAEINKKAQQTALKAFKTLCCEGMARVDMFVNENFEVLLNEINTIPGFTAISMYPSLLKQSGFSYSQIIDELINLAIARHKRDISLKSDFRDNVFSSQK